MRVIRVIPDLVVDDLASSHAFYADYLGLTHEDLGLDWVTRYTAAGGGTLQLLTRDVSAAVAPALSVAVDDVDAAHDEAVRRGYPIVHPLTTEPWGVRRFFVETPDGQVINVLQHRE